MGKEKNKFYVVWQGIKPGVYSSWAECQKLINGYPQAKYKGFKTQQAALKAFEEGPGNYWGKSFSESSLSPEQLRIIGIPIMNSISVDAAWNTFTLEMEYQGVWTDTKEVLFKKGPFKDATNNVGEFLAIVHALAHLKKSSSSLPIYSDSRNAIKWVKNKEHKSKLEKTNNNIEVFELLDRAIYWLKNNSYSNKILKWETKAWGENPADFGRK
ncbi:MAG: ribonuclease H [Chitinophagaceae bacterium]|nr:ribonuclease H [Chitinophagaceae bacterium]